MSHPWKRPLEMCDEAESFTAEQIAILLIYLESIAEEREVDERDPWSVFLTVRRPRVIVRWTYFKKGGCTGLIETTDDGHLIQLEADTDMRQARRTLAHELSHFETGILFDDDDDLETIKAGEAAVRLYAGERFDVA